MGMLVNSFIFGASGPLPVNPGPNFYIASTGSDDPIHGNGTSLHPWRTFAYALSLIAPLLATQAANFILHVVDDVVTAAEIALTATHSGQNGFNFILDGGAVGLSSIAGSISARSAPITGWASSGVAPGAFVASYTSVNCPSAIYIDGERAYPSFRGSGLITPTLTVGGYTVGVSEPILTTRNKANVKVVYLSTYNQPWNNVIAASGTSITMLAPQHGYITDDPNFLVLGPPYIPSDVVNCYEDWVANALPGTFYFDQAANNLYYIPRYGEDLSTATVTAWNGVETLLSITGADHIIVRGLAVQYADWSMPDGFGDRYSGFYYNAVNTPDYTNNSGETNMLRPPAAVYVSGSTNIQIVDEVRILHHGSMGLHITNACANVTVTGVKVDDCAGNLYVIGDSSEALGSTCCDTILTANCFFGHGGRLFAGSQGFIPVFWVNSDFSNNTVYDVPYNGMESGLGGSVNAAFMDKCGNNSVTNNWFINTMTGGTAIGGTKDGGAIGTNNPQDGIGAGLTIQGNFIQYTAPAQSGIFVEVGIYLDEDSDGVTIGGAGLLGNVVQYARQFALYHNLPVGNTVVVNVNLSDEGTAQVLSVAPSVNTAPTVSANPAISVTGAAIIAAGGIQEPYKSLLLPVGVWDTIIAALDPLIWYRNDEASGTTVTNHGSAGSGNGTVAGGFTLNEPAIFTGISRLNTSFDGASGKVTSTVVAPVNFGKNDPFTIIGVIMPNLARTTLEAVQLISNADEATADQQGWQLRADYTNAVIDNWPPARTILIGSIVSDAATNDLVQYGGCADLLNDVAHVVAMSYTGNGLLSGLTLWVDGIPQPKFVPTDTLSGAISSSHALDAASFAGTNFFPGQFADAIVIGGCLTQTQIENVTRAAGVSIPPAPPSADDLLLETGDFVLLEDGFKLELE